MKYWDHVDRVTRAGTLDEIKAATAAYTRVAGFRHHGYATRLREPLSGGGDFVYFEDFDSEWSKTCPNLRRPQSEQTDPRIVLSREDFPAVASNSRGRTGYEAPRIALALRTRKTLIQAGEFGLHGGITVPSWPPGTRWAFTTFTHKSPLDPRELLPVLGESVYFVSSMHAAMDRLLRRPVDAPRLSEREFPGAGAIPTGRSPQGRAGAFIRLIESRARSAIRPAGRPRGDYPVPMTSLPDRPDSGSDPPSDDDDAALFRAAIGEVRRLPDAAPPPAAPKPRALPRMAERDEALAREEFRHALDTSLLEAGDALSYRREELPPKVFARLRRGELSAQEELDLHGSPAREAEALLRAFLNDARDHGLGCVRIIHGKGRNGVNDYLDSRGLPVLKNLVDRMLRQRADVLAFHSAPPAQGGTGAVLVLLAKPQRRR